MYIRGLQARRTLPCLYYNTKNIVVVVVGEYLVVHRDRSRKINGNVIVAFRFFSLYYIGTNEIYLCLYTGFK